MLVVALDLLDVALRARGVGGAPWLHAMRTHELAAALRRRRSGDEKAADLAARFAADVAAGVVAPPGKHGADPRRRARAVAAFADVAALTAEAGWPRDPRVLAALAAPAPFPPPGAVAIVAMSASGSSSGTSSGTCGTSGTSSLASAKALRARASSATARLFKLGAVLAPAPPDLQRPGELRFAVADAPGGVLAIQAALAEPCARVRGV